jgi:hypothetical protein
MWSKWSRDINCTIAFFDLFVPDTEKKNFPGTDVRILKIFLLKYWAKILAFFAQTAASFSKNLIVTLAFEKNTNFFAKNWQKSQKTVIITSTPEEILVIKNGPTIKVFLILAVSMTIPGKSRHLINYYPYLSKYVCMDNTKILF